MSDTTKQDLIENTSTCSYTCTCPKDGCSQVIGFTDITRKYVMVTGLADEDVHKEMIGWESLDESMRQSVF